MRNVFSFPGILSSDPDSEPMVLHGRYIISIKKRIEEKSGNPHKKKIKGTYSLIENLPTFFEFGKKIEPVLFTIKYALR